MKSVLLYSGGMDSYCLRYLLNPSVLLYVDIGAQYSKEEIQRLPKGCIVISLGDLSQFETSSGILPCRNALYTIIASNYGEQIILGATDGDRVRDKDENFSLVMSNLLTYLWSDYWVEQARTITVSVPFKNKTKREIVAEYVRKGGNIQRLAQCSYSCYRGLSVPCGACKPCYRKYVALALNGYVDYQYAVNPLRYIEEKVLPGLLCEKNKRGREDEDILQLIGE